MTWQDELQQLDADLAAGRISAEDYRARRDAVMGRAQATQQGMQQQPPSGGFPQPGPESGGFPQQDPQSGGFPQQSPQSGGFPQQNPQSGGFPQQGPQATGFPQQDQQGGQAQSPFPPAFNWGQAANQGAQSPADANSTQIVNVRGQQAQQPQQQFPQQQEWPQQPNAWGRPQQQGWGAGAASTSAPWDDPNEPTHGDTSWMRQGPEVFETSSGAGKGKWIGLSLGAVLLVGVAVAGVFYFTTSSGSQEPPQAQQTEAPAEPPAPPPPPPPPPTPELPEPPAPKPAPAAAGPEALVPPPPGPPHPFNGLIDRPGLEGPRGGLLPPDVKDFALQNGFVDGWFHGTDGTEPKTTLIAIRMPDENGARALTEKYLQGQAGLAEVEDLSFKGVPVVSTGGGIVRTAYTSHNWTVIVDVSSPDALASRDLFQQILTGQLGQSPPTVRD
ncbi:hypothetical protein GIY23_00390 [Allosaccharopolyspora coralli]|uniref:DUF1707 domain-containing protein n=1 Tax=Allosaccharopolyspora coralli TaxID=2665642 RepID=A0A5Q3Q9H9_9PSEU|nr:hypothetical protein [Allosaccharopolyspora coralli]QGK68239.1 hypothetical protein GIY23_00390 [Allosaccharopolyspora coralli]